MSDDDYTDDFETLDEYAEEDDEETAPVAGTDIEFLNACAMRSCQRNIMRRALSEQHMNDVLDWHLERGCAYHIISTGDIDFLTYMRGIVKAHPLEYLLCSTWCAAMEDAQEIAMWIRRGMVKRCDFYVGEIFIQHYAEIFQFLKDFLPRNGGGRLCMSRNHAKVMVGYYKDGDRTEGVVVTSSANINTNPRIEQAVITTDTAVADFYKEFFDGLKPRNPWPYEWTPWRPRSCRTTRPRGTS